MVFGIRLNFTRLNGRAAKLWKNFLMPIILPWSFHRRTIIAIAQIIIIRLNCLSFKSSCKKKSLHPGPCSFWLSNQRQLWLSSRRFLFYYFSGLAPTKILRLLLFAMLYAASRSRLVRLHLKEDWFIKLNFERVLNEMKRIIGTQTPWNAIVVVGSLFLVLVDFFGCFMVEWRCKLWTDCCMQLCNLHFWSFKSLHACTYPKKWNSNAQFSSIQVHRRLSSIPTGNNKHPNWWARTHKKFRDSFAQFANSMRRGHRCNN